MIKHFLPILLISFIFSCSSKKKKDQTELGVPSVVVDETVAGADQGDSTGGTSVADLSTQVGDQNPFSTNVPLTDIAINSSSDDQAAGPLQSIYFPYNSSVLTEAAKDALQANADFLQSETGVQVLIEGHCDERGGIQYNLALGERRAASVRDYLSALGVSSYRMSIVSFGKERPMDYGHDEIAWSRNRRTNFVVTTK